MLIRLSAISLLLAKHRIVTQRLKYSKAGKTKIPVTKPGFIQYISGNFRLLLSLTLSLHPYWPWAHTITRARWSLTNATVHFSWLW